MEHYYPYQHEWHPMDNYDLSASRADAGSGLWPSGTPMKHVNDLKAWMYGPSAHDERVADLKVKRHDAMRAHEHNVGVVKNGMYELHYLRKPLEDAYSKQCEELPRMSEELNKSMRDLKALEQILKLVQAENDAYHAKASTNSYAPANLSSITRHDQDTY